MSAGRAAWPGRRAMAVSLAAIVLALALPAPSIADYRSAYREARTAADQKKWSEVVRLTREAITDEPKPGKKIKIYGMRFEPYLPYTLLGRALTQLGRCEEALEAFAQALDKGAVRRSADDLEALNRARQLCETRLAQSRPTAPPTPVPTSPLEQASLDRLVAAGAKSIDEVKRLQQEVADLAADPDLQEEWRANDQLGRRQKQADELLAKAVAQFDEGRQAGRTEVVEEAVGLVELARDVYRKVLDRGARRRQAILAEKGAAAEAAKAAAARAEERRRDALRGELDQLVAQATDLEATATAIPNRSASFQRYLELLREQRDEAKKASTAGPLPPLERLRDELSGSVMIVQQYVAALQPQAQPTAAPGVPTEVAAGRATPTARVAGPPPELLAAATAYFSGRYAQVAKIVEEARLATDKERFHAHLLAAAAHYALWVLSGQGDEELLATARNHARAAKKIMPAVELSTVYYSPRFRRFWTES